MLIFISVSITGMLHHEIWLDEAQHFLLARDSGSLQELYFNMRYDGHPRLWNFLLYGIIHLITPRPLGMQLFQLLLITAVAWVFVRYAPFPLSLKLLVLFGYYFLFEYNVLSRNYTPGILLLFGICVLFRQKWKHLLIIGLLLFLLCNVHLFCLFAAIGIYAATLPGLTRKQFFSRRFVLFTLLFLAGAGCTLLQVHVPADNTYFHPRFVSLLRGANLLDVLSAPAKAWLPVPDIHHASFWNSYLISSWNIAARTGLGLALLFLPGFALRKSKPALVFYIVSCSGMLAFIFLAQMAAARYFGMLFIFFLAGYWIAGRPARDGMVNIILYALLVIQLFAGSYAFIGDYRHPFSQAKNTVAFLKEHQLDRQLIAVDGYNAGPSLCAYLGKKVFYLDIGQTGSFCYWKKSFFPPVRATLSHEFAISGYIAAFDQFILVSNRVVPPDEQTMQAGTAVFRLQELKRFQGSIVQSENYYVYQAEREPVKKSE